MKLTDNQKKGFWLSAAFVAVAGTIIGLRSYDSVPKNSFAVRVKGNEVQKELYQPGYYPKRFFLDDFYSFSNNTVIMEAVVGKAGNTKQQNSFSMAVRLHYKIKPDAGVIQFHLDGLRDDNGKKLLTEQMNNSVDALVADTNDDDAMKKAKELLEQFIPQLQMRLKQNNIAVEIDMVELLDIRMGSGYRKPVQLMIRPGQSAQSMAGPSALPAVTPKQP